MSDYEVHQLSMLEYHLIYIYIYIMKLNMYVTLMMNKQMLKLMIQTWNFKSYTTSLEPS